VNQLGFPLGDDVKANDAKADLTDLRAVVQRQKALGHRLLWLFLLPFAITAAIIPMFFVLSARISDVETLARQLNIERYLLVDQNFALAIDQYNDILKSKQSAPVLARLGVLYFQRDQKNSYDAIKLLEKAKEIDPQYWETYRNLSYIFTASGRAKDAIAAGMKALDINKNDAITLSNLAWVYSKSEDVRDLELAQQYAERALALTGMGEKRSEVLDTLAEVYYQMGGETNKAQSLVYFNEAIDTAPTWRARSYREHLRTDFPGQP
jgi:tetratricopeptide (TPR) repeat protein